MTQLTVEDLHKRYGDHEVLKGVSLSAEAGDVITIIGSSGSGKSTFLRCINFLEQPDAGRKLAQHVEDHRFHVDAHDQPPRFRVSRAMTTCWIWLVPS